MEQIPRVKRKTKQRWMTDDILDLMEKRSKRSIEKNTKHCIRKSEKYVMKQKRSGSMTKQKRSGSMTSAKASNQK